MKTRRGIPLSPASSYSISVSDLSWPEKSTVLFSDDGEVYIRLVDNIGDRLTNGFVTRRKIFYSDWNDPDSQASVSCCLPIFTEFGHRSADEDSKSWVGHRSAPIARQKDVKSLMLT